MIKIGATGWGDHQSLYEDLPGAKSQKLETYGSFFPIVELDSSFYAIPSARSVERWIDVTQQSFQFIVKAYQGMTGHQRGEIPYPSKKEMFKAFRETFLPLKKQNKLALVLMQFPPWFDCKKLNVDYLSVAREELAEFDVALEFRHQSWFNEENYTRTIDYMKMNNWINSMCDEPQVEPRSIPFVPEVTSKRKAFVRLHGRNEAAWTKPVDGEEWREVRYLYEYTEKELEDFSLELKKIASQTKETFVVFNNNSGGHAAGNALQLIDLMNIHYEGLAPRQLNLF